MKKVLSIIMVLIMVLSVIMIIPFGVSAKEVDTIVTGISKTADEAIAWCKSKVGQQVETFDSRSEPLEYRWQCVDFVAAYYQFLGVDYVTCDGGQYGNVWQPSGMIPIQGATPQKGDVLVYSGNAGNPAGHVAIYESDYSTYQQRSNNVDHVENVTSHYLACGNPYWGVIRPCFGGSSSFGDGFYALITHMASWNHLTNETNGNVDICWENYTVNQYWKFYRQSDESYIIKNAATGKCLEVSGGSSLDGANIQVGDLNNSDAQKWEIIPCGNGYQLKAKCTNCVMEMNAWSFYQGVNLVSGSRDGSSAEIFAINRRDFNVVGKTELRVAQVASDVVFSWDNALCSNAYNIQVYPENSVSGNRVLSLWNVKNNTYTYHFEDGTYTAYLECFNGLGDYVNSSAVTFTVNNNPQGFVDIGTGFYASVSHIASGKYITAQEDGNVNICSDTNIADQYWKFFRQGDGSYIIKNAKNGQCLDVKDSSGQDGANIIVSDENNSNSQKWYIYPCGDGYQLKSKCTACVMEMNAWSFYEKVNLVSGIRDGSSAEVFAINYKDFADIGNTILLYELGDGCVTFTWPNARCSTNYNIKIWFGDSVLSGEAPINLWNVKNNTYEVQLGEGEYTAYIESYNAFGDYVQSKPITFSIMESMPLVVVKGDVDRDGSITITDATRIQQWLAKIIGDDDIDLEAAKTTDDPVSITDATRIQQHLAKIINLLEA